MTGTVVHLTFRLLSHARERERTEHVLVYMEKTPSPHHMLHWLKPMLQPLFQSEVQQPHFLFNSQQRGNYSIIQLWKQKQKSYFSFYTIYFYNMEPLRTARTLLRKGKLIVWKSAHSWTKHSWSQHLPGALSYCFSNTQCPSAKSSIILKSSNCVTITLDIFDMGRDSQTARTQHLFFITFPLTARQDQQLLICLKSLNTSISDEFWGRSTWMNLCEP